MTAFAATAVHQEIHDLAEQIGFIHRVEEMPTFDPRSDRQLREVGLEGPDPVERERALWELAQRLRSAAVPTLSEAFARETVPSIRWNLLWLAVKVGGGDAFPLLESAVGDPHVDVRDWAKLFLRETVGADLAMEHRQAAYTTAGDFDQTLPLQIAGFALVVVPGMGARRASLSPLWFEQIMGRVLACTNLDTIASDLVIEKNLCGYHPDGSDHYEIFPFSGVSWNSGETMQHRYESCTLRPFYTSGKVEDRSREVFDNVPVILNRGAETTPSKLEVLRATDLREIRVLPQQPLLQPGRIPATLEKPIPTTDLRGIKLLDGRVVTSVRGQFFGWAHTSLEHFTRTGRVDAGTVQLANPLDPRTAPYVNTYLCGTFRGKLSDWDGDGVADLNLIPCHGTADGKLDYTLDGTHAPDPFA